MHKITAVQFKRAIELDPARASKLTEPVEITDFCDMAESKITHLSPLLHFTGVNEDGNCASFWGCKSLKVAEGRFKGFVDFSYSGIEKIGDLSCRKNNYGNCAFFQDCKSLRVAKGKFSGAVYFSNAGIEKIGDLCCGKNKNGDSANFFTCESLKIAEGKFEGSVSFSTSSISKIGDLTCGKDNKGIRLNIKGCPNLKSIPFNPEEIIAQSELIRNLIETRAFIKKKRTEIVEIEL